MAGQQQRVSTTGSTAQGGEPGSRRERQVEEAAVHHGSHGHSTAAWVGVAIILVGAAVMAVAVALTSLWVFVAGVVVVVLGAVAGKVLQMMGFGQQVYDREVPAPHRGVR